MKKIISLFCAVALALGVSAQPIALEKATVKNFKAEKSFAKAELKKAPAAQKAPAATIEGWTELGQAVVTETFGAPFGYDEDVYETTVYKNNTTEGLYAIDNEWYDESEGADSIIQIHAEDPELCYILPTSLTFTNENYGYLQTLSAAGRYLAAGYDANTIIGALGNGADVWGKKVKNIITFSEDAMLVCLTAAKSGQPGYYYGKRLIIELPDLTAPIITAANEVSIGAEKAIFAIVADDDVDVVDSLTFTIKNGETVLEAAAKTTNGQLTISGLTKNTAYNLTLIATDRAGRASEAFAFSFTTIAEDDTQAPTLAKAEVKEVSDKWATVTVEATDNVTAAADLLFVVTFADESSVELAATEGVIKIAGLTPETKYDVTVAAKDKAGNKSEAKALSFTTLELIPIILNVDDAEARYYSAYSQAGAQNYEISFYEGEDNYVLFDSYLPENKKLSGTYGTANGTIGTQYSAIKYNGANVKLVAAVLSLEFVEYSNAEAGQGNYKVAFQAMGDDGNLYIGSVTINVLTYYVSNDSYYYYPMIGEVPVELTMTSAKSTYTESENSIEYVLSNDDYDFYFHIYLAEGLTDVVSGETYTYDVDMKSHSTLSYGDAGNDNYIDYASAEFVKTVADGKIQIKATIVDTNDQNWILTYEGTDPGTAIDNAKVAVKATKRIVNGQMIIRANGQEFNAQGVEIR